MEKVLEAGKCREMMDQQGKMKSPQGVIRATDAIYIGEMENGVPFGLGRMTIMRPGFKTVLDGSFRDGKVCSQ